MIYYFSGTGNSKWVAEKIAESIGEELVDISLIGQEKNDKYISQIRGNVIGIVFPVYAWSAPEIVNKFAEKFFKLHSQDKRFRFVVATCGKNSGRAVQNMSKKINANYGYAIVMPNNYILGSEPDSDETVEKKLSEAENKIYVLCSEIKNKIEKIYDIPGIFPSVKSSVISAGFNKYGRKTAPFYAKENCNGCGTCSERCPYKSIIMLKKHPVWNSSSCIMCLKCINCCPVCAIDYGKKTKKRKRYFIEKYI